MTQLERLQNDCNELENFEQTLIQEGDIELVKKVSRKREFLEGYIEGMEKQK